MHAPCLCECYYIEFSHTGEVLMPLGQQQEAEERILVLHFCNQQKGLMVLASALVSCCRCCCYRECNMYLWHATATKVAMELYDGHWLSCYAAPVLLHQEVEVLLL